MELRNIKTFLNVTEYGSFTKAAENLGYTQSTVSFQIQQIENELGVRLFDRINHTVSLTEAGNKFLKHALDIEHDMKDMREDFNEDEEALGVVRMVSSDSICEKMMLSHYYDYYERFPNVRLEFSTTNTEDMLKILDRHEADMVFTLDTHVYRDDYVIARESVVPLHFVMSPDFYLAKKKVITIEDILKSPVMLTEKDLSYRRILDNTLAEKSLSLKPVLEIGRTDVLASLAASGDFVTFLPDFVTEPMVREGSLVRVNVNGLDLKIWKQLIYRKDKWMSKTMQLFMDYVIEKEFDW